MDSLPGANSECRTARAQAFARMCEKWNHLEEGSVTVREERVPRQKEHECSLEAVNNLAGRVLGTRGAMTRAILAKGARMALRIALAPEKLAAASTAPSPPRP
jgi:hypothetical protein